MSLLIQNHLLLCQSKLWIPKGLYTYNKLVQMIFTDGYIPVANANELNNLRLSTTQKMGEGTPFEANYVTGVVGKKYVQLDDIDLSGVANFEPIGDQTSILTEYDGNNLEIKNLTVNYTNRNYVGLIGQASNIKNMNVSGDVISSTTANSYIGGCAGGVNMSVTNCHFYGNVTGYSIVGGVVGTSSVNGGTIDGCTFNGTITSTHQYTGGIVGSFRGVYVRNCYANCTLTTSNSNVGGIVGGSSISANSYMSIENCQSNVTINSTAGSYIGGIIGSSVAFIAKCFANVNISVNSGVSGFIGGITGSMGPTTQNSSISECYATGSIQGTAQYYVGGLAGDNYKTIENCYTKVVVNLTGSGGYSAGFVGRVRAGATVNNCYQAAATTLPTNPRGGFCSVNDGTITNSYWDLTIGYPTSVGGTGKTTTELQADAIGTGIYAAWSTDIWEKQTGAYYPTLINNPEP